MNKYVRSITKVCLNSDKFQKPGLVYITSNSNIRCINCHDRENWFIGINQDETKDKTSRIMGRTTKYVYIYTQTTPNKYKTIF